MYRSPDFGGLCTLCSDYRTGRWSIDRSINISPAVYDVSNSKKVVAQIVETWLKW